MPCPKILKQCKSDEDCCRGWKCFGFSIKDKMCISR
uniref:U14-ctenitoxin-Pn1a n=1 Tax=Phoneutria nigriventer TaxID=6918 RepID=TX22_PHONI|nr:RecName: Full=U14-ctenitoxin-Pn1a; Short=U14-CNTX-Pn1a; AltName: Full=Neurotoxin PNTx22A0C1 [Phoneutria nigriventer]